MKITKELIQEFISFYQADLYKTLTLKRFEREFTKFAQYAKKKWVDEVEKINIPLIEDYKSYYMRLPVPITSRYYSTSPKLSPKTIEEKIQTIKNFFIFTSYKYWIWLDPEKIRLPRAKSKRMDYFTYDEIQKIVKAIDEYEPYEINSIRLKLIILIGFTTWLRLSEIMNLQVYQVMNWSATVHTKWDKEREVFFSANVRKLLARYLELREQPLPRIWRKSKKKSDIDWVIISHHDQNFWAKCVKSTICRQFKRLDDHVRVPGKRLSCHTLRHSCGTYLLEKWVNIRYIQDILGHVHMNTTQLYLHPENLKKKEIHDEIMEAIEIEV